MVTSGTSALITALLAINIKIGDKVLLLLKESQKSSLSTDKITEDLAWKRINS